jgi:DNA-binding MarR family transcriptional regulator
MSADSFSDALEGFFRAMRRARTRWAHAGKNGKDGKVGPLTPSQFVLVVPLLARRPMSVRDLALGAEIAPPTATRTLDGLERDGLVVRRPSEADRRCVLVELTDEGRAAVLAARIAIRERRRVLYDALEPGEREEAERLLRRLAEILGRD